MLRFPDGKPSFWAVGKTGTIYYKGRRNQGIDGHKVKLLAMDGPAQPVEHFITVTWYTALPVK